MNSQHQGTVLKHDIISRKVNIERGRKQMLSSTRAANDKLYRSITKVLSLSDGLIKSHISSCFS